MIINTKYDIGQRIWTIRKERRFEQNRCKFCGGSGIVNAVSNNNTGSSKPVRCPECNGQGFFSSKESTLVYSVGSCSEIGAVEYREIHFPRGKRTVEIRYMLKFSGIGSGTLWPEDELFPTVQEAQEYCDRMNEKENGVERSHYQGDY